jgi:PKD repeat protein
LDATFGADAPPHYAHWRVRFDGVMFGAASYAWQFGDGKSAQTTAPLAFHRYAEAGTFDVTLVVTDAAGNSAQSTLQVSVASLPNPSRLPSIAGPSLRSRKDPGYSRVASHEAGAARSVFCWNAADWTVLEKAFDENAVGGYVDPVASRRIGLSPAICSRLDLVEYRRPAPGPTTKIAVAVLVLAREIQQSQGYLNAAQATCYGLQTVPDTAELSGATPTAAAKLGRLAARWYKRPNLPPGSWSAQCKDGGKLDLDRLDKHWP